MKKIILELDNVEKSFGSNKAHKGVSFQLHQGETLGLLGGSGTGKSVLLRSLIGLEFIDSGKILFHDKPIQDLREEKLFEIRKKISYSFQYGALFDSINVFENLAYPLFCHTDFKLDEIELRIKDILKLIGLEGKELTMPSDLSGGMQKRVGIARAIMLNPEIVLYDEPTAGLDPVNTNNILNLMQQLAKKDISSIFVTHDIPAALKICDRIIILHQGKIYFNGTPKDFIDSRDPIVKNFFLSSLPEVHS